MARIAEDPHFQIAAQKSSICDSHGNIRFRHYRAGEYRGPINSLEIVAIDDTHIAITVMDEVTPKGVL